MHPDQTNLETKILEAARAETEFLMKILSPYFGSAWIRMIQDRRLFQLIHSAAHSSNSDRSSYMSEIYRAIETMSEYEAARSAFRSQRPTLTISFSENRMKWSRSSTFRIQSSGAQESTKALAHA